MVLVVGEIGQPAAIGVHHVDLVFLPIVRESKCDPCPIGRPDGVQLISRAVGEIDDAAAVGIHHIDLTVPIAVGHEGDLPPIG